MPNGGERAGLDLKQDDRLIAALVRFVRREQATRCAAILHETTDNGEAMRCRVCDNTWWISDKAEHCHRDVCPVTLIESWARGGD